ncbi:shikimate dehydrogenase [Scytonema hofmannii PCC 7110]|uniref:Shikimate dehydrogenase (NADP(+)) n=1 Tax=Scytonema hofmannii PCC 7110 TaxID=128403 RepID=A0A139WVG6_9CYAN|nr:shikimate dehydrogenase [Scytonema hofmannii]KYC36414.1 shikimate dehydrogenase [Scytonema hofmannii PCC 7110]
MITGKTKLLGIIGHPIEHSLSPVMQNAAIAHMELDYVYIPFPVEPHNLKVALQAFASIGVVGFNATIPHKETILPLLSEISSIAEAVGAVNTVSRKDHKWIGTNTDVEGFLAPLETTYNRDWHQTVAVVLGNGGAARAVVAGCAKLGCAEIYVVGRNAQKLNEFRNSWSNSPIAVNLQVSEWSSLSKLLPQANLLVNTTPIGMYPKAEESPLDTEEMMHLPEDAIAYDLIYKPKPTKFLQQAQQAGITTIDGLEMLVQQGAAALKIWLQPESVPVDVMRQSLFRQLGFQD